MQYAMAIPMNTTNYASLNRGRRYSTYWCAYGTTVSERARQVIDQRQAVEVPIADADSFFSSLTERVEAIESLHQPDPLSTELAVAMAKRYLSEPRHRIRLEDLYAEEAGRVFDYTRGAELPVDTASGTTGGALRGRLSRYEASTETLCQLAATLAWYDDGSAGYVLTRAIERLASPVVPSGRPLLLELMRYPALRISLAAGMASIASGRFAHLRAVLADPTTRTSRGTEPLIHTLNCAYLFGQCARYLFPGRERAGGSEHLWGSLREVLRRHVTSDEDYARAFYLFEFLTSLIATDLSGGQPPIPVGSFRSEWDAVPYVEDLVRSVAVEGQAGRLLKSGLFGGSGDRFRAALARCQEVLNSEGYLYPVKWPDLVSRFDEAAQAGG